MKTAVLGRTVFSAVASQQRGPGFESTICLGPSCVFVWVLSSYVGFFPQSEDMQDGYSCLCVTPVTGCWPVQRVPFLPSSQLGSAPALPVIMDGWTSVLNCFAWFCCSCLQMSHIKYPCVLATIPLLNSLTWQLAKLEKMALYRLCLIMLHKRDTTPESLITLSHTTWCLYTAQREECKEGYTNYSCTDVTGEPLHRLIMKSITQERRFVFLNCSFMEPNLRPCCLRPCRVGNCIVLVLVRLLLLWLHQWDRVTCCVSHVSCMRYALLELHCDIISAHRKTQIWIQRGKLFSYENVWFWRDVFIFWNPLIHFRRLVKISITLDLQYSAAGNSGKSDKHISFISGLGVAAHIILFWGLVHFNKEWIK